jgi:hypothetical protein
MNMTQSEVMELDRKEREAFVSTRMQQEIKVSAWAEKLLKVDPEVLAGVELPEEITLRALIPEFYVDEPNQAVYDKQWEAADKLFEKVNKIIEEYNKEALRCLSEYKVLVSK